MNSVSNNYFNTNERPDLSDSKTNLDPVILAQLENPEMVPFLINQPQYNNKESLDALFKEAVKIYDASGNNVAMEIAKKINEFNLRNDALETVEILLLVESNAVFKKNLSNELEIIRKHLNQAIEKTAYQTSEESTEWFYSLPEIKKAAIESEIQAVKEHFKNKDPLTVTGPECIVKALSQEKEIASKKEGPVDLILAPNTLYNKMQEIFDASEALLKGHPVEEHPLYPYFTELKEGGAFIASLSSGPNVPSFTDLLLEKHDLNLSENPLTNEHIDLKIFNNAETFLRALDIFKTHFEKKTGKTIDCEITHSIPHIPIETFCEEYLKRYPELATLNFDELEKFVRLLFVFKDKESITDLNYTLKMSVKQNTLSKRSFKPINQTHTQVQTGSNDLSQGQHNLDQQLQNLNGSEISMPYIKDADGVAQFECLSKLLHKKTIKLVDIGGGRGETNAVPNALHESGCTVDLLNIEPNGKFANPYIDSHHALGIKDVSVSPLYIQQLSARDIIGHYKGEKADALLASHSFYFILSDMLKASYDSSLPLNQHPVFKYFDMMEKDALLLVTMQTGAGARLIRNALMGNHGLNPANLNLDSKLDPKNFQNNAKYIEGLKNECASLLNSFGNIGTFLRQFEVFRERFEKETGKKLAIKIKPAVANVPLGSYSIDKEEGYKLHNQNESDTPWVSPEMFDFYGNWKDLSNKIEKGSEKEKETALKTKEIFLHILRAFAPGGVNMQHPNITLEISVR